jgi:hypothetical protein
MDEVVLDRVNPSQVALGKRKQPDSRPYTEIDGYDGIGGLYADDIEYLYAEDIEDLYAEDIKDLYAEDNLSTGSIYPRAGNGATNPGAHRVSDECEDFGEAVFADDESEGGESVGSFMGDDTANGIQTTSDYGGMDYGDDATAHYGESIAREKVSVRLLSLYPGSNFHALVCAPCGF